MGRAKRYNKVMTIFVDETTDDNVQRFCDNHCINKSALFRLSVNIYIRCIENLEKSAKLPKQKGA